MATKVKIVQFPNIEKAKKIERMLINKLQPKFNIKEKIIWT